MNNLSWMLYWADILPNLSVALGVIGGLGLSFSTAIIVIFTINIEYLDGPEKRALKLSKIFAFIFIPMGLLACFIPSKNTLYMIAGSEMGGKAIETPEFQKVRKVINNFLDKQLKDEDKKED